MSMINDISNNKKLNIEEEKSTIDSVVQPPQDCWILDGKSYRYNNLRQMPAVQDKYRKVLDALGLPYSSEAEDLLVFWNPSYEAYEKKEGDLYTKHSDGTYTLIGSHTGFTPSAMMCSKAIELCEMVSEEINLYNFYHFFKHKLDGKIYSINLVKKARNNRIFWNGQEIRVYSIPISLEKSLQVLFDMNKMWHSDLDNLEINLPDNLKGFASRIAGQDNGRLKKWAEDFGLDSVTLK